MSDYPNRPLIGVGVVVLKDDPPRAPRVLLVRRTKAPNAGRWSLPGGRQRLGETVHAAALREVREETGLEVELAGLLEVVDSIHRDDKGAVAYHYTLVDFLALWRVGEPRAGGDAAEAIWADPDDLRSYDLWDETRRVIQLARARWPASPDIPPRRGHR